MSFPNRSGAGPDEIVRQIVKDLVKRSNGYAGLNLSRPLPKLINFIGGCKMPEPQ